MPEHIPAQGEFPDPVRFDLSHRLGDAELELIDVGIGINPVSPLPPIDQAKEERVDEVILIGADRNKWVDHVLRQFATPVGESAACDRGGGLGASGRVYGTRKPRNWRERTGCAGRLEN